MSAAVPNRPGPGSTDLWVVGNVLIDLMMKGVPEMPRWGEEVLATSRSEEIGGQGANLARAAARFGLATQLTAIVGDDGPGTHIRETIEAEGIGTDGFKVVSGQTALAIAAVREDGERAFITDLGASTTLSAEDLAGQQDALHTSRTIALVGTSNLPGIDLASTAVLLTEAQGRGVLTVFDPGWGEGITSGHGVDEILQASGVFLPNRDEAEALTGQRQLGDILGALRDRCAGTVIVTCGSEGSATLDRDGPVMVQSLPVHVDNAVGAGDVFAAGVISGLLDGGDHVAAMVRGTAAAASYISRSQNRYDAMASWPDLASAVKISRL